MFSCLPLKQPFLESTTNLNLSKYILIFIDQSIILSCIFKNINLYLNSDKNGECIHFTGTIWPGIVEIVDRSIYQV